MGSPSGQSVSPKKAAGRARSVTSSATNDGFLWVSAPLWRLSPQRFPHPGRAPGLRTPGCTRAVLIATAPQTCPCRVQRGTRLIASAMPQPVPRGQWFGVRVAHVWPAGTGAACSCPCPVRHQPPRPRQADPVCQSSLARAWQSRARRTNRPPGRSGRPVVCDRDAAGCDYFQRIERVFRTNRTARGARTPACVSRVARHLAKRDLLRCASMQTHAAQLTAARGAPAQPGA